MVAVEVVDRAVRSAGKACRIERDLGPQRCGPSRLRRQRFSRGSGFTPKTALPIIAALGGGPCLIEVRVRGECLPLKRGNARGPMVPFFRMGLRFEPNA